MPKRRSRLLPVSLLCIAGLALVGWQGAPWNRPAMTPLAKWKVPQWVSSVVWSRDGRAIVTHERNGAPLRCLPTGARLFATPSVGTAVSPDGRWLARLADSGVLRQVRVIPGGPIPSPGSNAPRPVPPRVVNQYRSRRVELVNVETGAVERRLALPQEVPDRLLVPNPKMTFFQGGKHLFLRGPIGPNADWLAPYDLEARWDTNGGGRLQSRIVRLTPLKDAIRKLFTPLGRVVTANFGPAAGASKARQPGGSIARVNVLRLEEVGARRRGLELPLVEPERSASSSELRLSDTLFSPQENVFAAGVYVPNANGVESGINATYVWKVANPTIVWRLDGFGPSEIVFSADGRLVAIAGVSGDETRLRAGHARAMLLIIEVRTSKQIASLNDDTPLQRRRRAAVHGWNSFAESAPVRLPQRRGEPRDEPARRLAWSPDGRRLAATYHGEDDGQDEIKIWAVPQP